MAKFKHWCPTCIPLGSHNEKDLYFCKESTNVTTVLARYGDGESEYLSGIHAAQFNEDLAEALNRAKQAGLIS